tara:strand:- start:619 stop:822 length:204 start_codon:yes stop_codon:yes gene_type:complete
MIKVDGYKNLYRDEVTGAIINCNDIEYNQRLTAISKSELHENELNRMREDIDELKFLIMKLLDNKQT